VASWFTAIIEATVITDDSVSLIEDNLEATAPYETSVVAFQTHASYHKSLEPWRGNIACHASLLSLIFDLGENVDVGRTVAVVNGNESCFQSELKGLSPA